MITRIFSIIPDEPIEIGSIQNRPLQHDDLSETIIAVKVLRETTREEYLAQKDIPEHKVYKDSWNNKHRKYYEVQILD